MPKEHVVTCCEDCPAENQGACLLGDRDLREFKRGATAGIKAAPDWCPLRRGTVSLRLEPDEETP